MDDQTISNSIGDKIMYRLKRVGREERRFLGVCGGLSKYIDREMDPVIIRLLWVVLTFFAPFMVLLYFILAIVLRSEDDVAPDENDGSVEDEPKNFKDFKEKQE